MLSGSGKSGKSIFFLGNVTHISLQDEVVFNSLCLIHSETTRFLLLYFIRKEAEAVSTGVIETSILSHGLLDPIELWRFGSEILLKVSRGIDFLSHA